ncbi:unnamed protein product, partial [Mesorhabditis belari]|uniref:Major facilitator superfamily (MFS) profile domain-containing protein n=1 Tax=Mesorhabditis belari TaxID=2138241 RepID=A0AAF3F4U2_9BILA
MSSSSSSISSRQLAFLVSIHIALTLITNFPSGFTNSTVNTAVEPLLRYINISYTEREWDFTSQDILWIHSAILNVWFLAQVFGATIAPYFTDKYGRKRGYLIGVAFTLCSSIVQAFSIRIKMPELLILGRAMTAFASPLCDTCLIMYIQETAPVELRGMLSFLPEIGYGSMCVLGSILGMPEVLGSSLERLLLVSLIPEVLSLLFLLCIPETPKYLMIIKGNREKSLKSLEFFQGKREKVNQFMLATYQKEKELDTSGKKRSSIWEVIRKWQLRRSVLLGCSVFVLTLSFYPMLQSSTFFFLRSGFRKDLAEMSSTGLLVLMTISTCLGSQIIDRFPRRTLVLTFGALSNIFLLAFAIFSSLPHNLWIQWAGLASIVCYIITFALVLGPIGWFIAPELVSQRHKSTVFALCYSIGNVMITITNFSVVPLFKAIGGVTFIPLFVIPSAFCLIFLYFCLPETLGKETHEIIEEMTGRKKSRKQKNLQRVGDEKSAGIPVQFVNEESDSDSDDEQYNETVIEKF